MGGAPPISAVRRGVAPAPAKYEREPPGRDRAGGAGTGRAGSWFGGFDRRSVRRRSERQVVPRSWFRRGRSGPSRGWRRGRDAVCFRRRLGCAGPARGNKGGPVVAAAPRNQARAFPAASPAVYPLAQPPFLRSGLGGGRGPAAPGPVVAKIPSG